MAKSQVSRKLEKQIKLNMFFFFTYTMYCCKKKSVKKFGGQWECNNFDFLFISYISYICFKFSFI